MDLREFSIIISGNYGKNNKYLLKTRIIIIITRIAGKLRRKIVNAFSIKRLKPVINIIIKI